MLLLDRVIRDARPGVLWMVDEEHAATDRPPNHDRSPWNLLLLVPLLMLVTPLWNHDEPRVFGLPMFYWSQFLFVPLGVVCVGLVVRAANRRERGAGRSDSAERDGGSR